MSTTDKTKFLWHFPRGDKKWDTNYQLLFLNNNHITYNLNLRIVWSYSLKKKKITCRHWLKQKATELFPSRKKICISCFSIKNTFHFYLKITCVKVRSCATQILGEWFWSAVSVTGWDVYEQNCKYTSHHTLSMSETAQGKPTDFLSRQQLCPREAWQLPERQSPER